MHVFCRFSTLFVGVAIYTFVSFCAAEQASKSSYAQVEFAQYIEFAQWEDKQKGQVTSQVLAVRT